MIPYSDEHVEEIFFAETCKSHCPMRHPRVSFPGRVSPTEVSERDCRGWGAELLTGSRSACTTMDRLGSWVWSFLTLLTFLQLQHDVSTTTMASTASDQMPISPIKLSKPELTISAAAINNEPIELDGTSISPEELRLARRGSKDEALEALGLGRAEREV